MKKGGMQSSKAEELYCKCGKPTSKLLVFHNGKEVSIHFGKKTYWHIWENNKIKRIFKKPKDWEL